MEPSPHCLQKMGARLHRGWNWLVYSSKKAKK